jgi:hypothetical protein
MSWGVGEARRRTRRRRFCPTFPVAVASKRSMLIAEPAPSRPAFHHSVCLNTIDHWLCRATKPSPLASPSWLIWIH